MKAADQTRVVEAMEYEFALPHGGSQVCIVVTRLGNVWVTPSPGHSVLSGRIDTVLESLNGSTYFDRFDSRGGWVITGEEG